eukprot:scaffold13609_cov106-Isochrysis_galbana.AAC.2
MSTHGAAIPPQGGMRKAALRGARMTKGCKVGATPRHTAPQEGARANEKLLPLVAALYNGPKEIAKTIATKTGKTMHMHTKSPCIATPVTTRLRRRSHLFFARYLLRHRSAGQRRELVAVLKAPAVYVQGAYVEAKWWSTGHSLVFPPSPASPPGTQAARREARRRARSAPAG